MLDYQVVKDDFLGKSVSHSVVPNSVTPWTVAHQALSMEFSRQEY